MKISSKKHPKSAKTQVSRIVSQVNPRKNILNHLKYSFSCFEDIVDCHVANPLSSLYKSKESIVNLITILNGRESMLMLLFVKSGFIEWPRI